MEALLDDQRVVQRVLDHIDHKTTDLGAETWREPVANYTCAQRFSAEIEMLKRLPVPFCPSAALPEAGSYVARNAAGIPLSSCAGMTAACGRSATCAATAACGSPTAAVARRRSSAVTTAGRIASTAGCSTSRTTAASPTSTRRRTDWCPCTPKKSVGSSSSRRSRIRIGAGALDGLPNLIAADQRIFATTETATDVNWKVFMEGNLEGYHIKPTHKTTFYPYGFDNLTLIETFGRNSRVTFPFRRIEKLRPLPPAERKIAGMVTFVYHLFPNVILAVLSNHTTMSVLEPVTPSRTRFHTYRLTNTGAAAGEGAGESSDAEADARAKRDAGFVSDTGGKEDAAMLRGIQNGISQRRQRALHVRLLRKSDRALSQIARCCAGRRIALNSVIPHSHLSVFQTLLVLAIELSLQIFEMLDQKL